MPLQICTSEEQTMLKEAKDVGKILKNWAEDDLDPKYKPLWEAVGKNLCKKIDKDLKSSSNESSSAQKEPSDGSSNNPSSLNLSGNKSKSRFKENK